MIDLQERRKRQEAVRKANKERRALQLAELRKHRPNVLKQAGAGVAVKRSAGRGNAIVRRPPKCVVDNAISYDIKTSSLYPQEIVYVVGGGPSLKTLDKNLLSEKFCIGINDAYLWNADGKKIIDVLTWGDWKWFNGFAKTKGHRENIKKVFGNNLVISSNSCFIREVNENFKYMKRGGHELTNDGRLGWFWNSGSMGIHLALLFGAKKVILLGMDLQKSKSGETNWHIPYRQGSNPAYAKFTKGFEIIAKQQPIVFPEAEIINAGLGTSALTCYRMMDREEAIRTY